MSPSDKPTGEVTDAVDPDGFGGGSTDGLSSSSLSGRLTETSASSVSNFLSTARTSLDEPGSGSDLLSTLVGSTVDLSGVFGVYLSWCVWCFTFRPFII